MPHTSKWKLLPRIFKVNIISQEHVINYFEGYNGLELEGEQQKFYIEIDF